VSAIGGRFVSEEAVERGSYRYAYLLVTLLTLIVIHPFLAGERPRPGLSGALTLAIFLAALWAVAGERRIRIIALLLALPAIADNLLAVAVPRDRPFLLGIVFGILFSGFITAVIFRGVVTSAQVTRDALYGAITAYLMLGLTWAWSYGLVDQLWPGSFRSLTSADGHLVSSEYLFLSFVTLTSVGYGDIVPLGGHARSLAMLEAIAGQMYLAIFMARLVGLYSQRR
jgi:hypothetical protein